jgi:hypothetical protein
MPALAVVYATVCISKLGTIIQLMPALKVNIIIVHPRGVVFPRENNIPKVNNYVCLLMTGETVI